jgi:NAD(P)-dependent dehydrogenase (short-subunit alcohol dehydrogenase family)
VINTLPIHATKMAAFEASSGASNALIRSLAVELGRHAIQINAVSPSYIETPLFLSDAERVTGVHPERVITELETKIRLPRLDESKDVAAPCTFTASGNLRYLLGASLTVAGTGSVQP